MDSDFYSLNDPVIFSDQKFNYQSVSDPVFTDLANSVSPGDADDISSGDADDISPGDADNILTADLFNARMDDVMAVIAPYSDDDIVTYAGSDLSDDINVPDHVVTYTCNGVDVYFPTSYCDDLIIDNDLIINLSSSYTVGCVLSGSGLSNYLSSEITIPTYHSSTWYQYLQTYGQPYRVVDRYINSYGSISSQTRDRSDLTWGGGNSWSGFTFDRIALLFILVIVLISFIFRRSK